MDSGRYPVSVYPVWMRIIVTFIIPIAVATTVPLQALRGDLNANQIMIFFMVAVVSFIVASRIWKSGLKRYSGASS
jgi:ABC-2 type transport system permease protein